jgi:hypothetical protein
MGPQKSICALIAFQTETRLLTFMQALILWIRHREGKNSSGQWERAYRPLNGGRART